MTILAAGLLAGCASTSGELSPVPRDVGVEEARRLVASGQVVPIDMRSPHEYSAGHIPGAVLVPFGSAGTAKQVRRAMGGKQGLIYCRTGRRTGLAMQELTGIPGVLHFAGGLTAWKASGGEIQSGDQKSLEAPGIMEEKSDVYRFRKPRGEREELSDVYKFF